MTTGAKPRKDFRDFVGLRPHNEDFRNLLTLAMPARFWTKNWSERSKKESYDINTAYLHYFLTLNGFYTLKDETTDDVRYIRMNDCIVRQVNAKDISAFLKGFTIERFLPVDIRNLILNSPRTGESSLSQLDEIMLDFTNYTSESQFLFFSHVTWEITKNGITEYKGRFPKNGAYGRTR